MYCCVQNGLANQNEIRQFISSLYCDANRLPSHLLTADSETVCIMSANKNMMAKCTLFENASYPQYLILGNYECVDNADVSKELFKEIEKIAIAKGKNLLLGPMNGNTWQAYRFSLLQKKSFLMEQTHQSYYPVQWQASGFDVFAEYHTNIETLSKDTEPSQDFFSTKGLQVRPFDKEHSERDFKLIYNLSMQSFKYNLFFAPIAWDDFLDLYRGYLSLIDEELIDLVFEGEELVGYLFAIENAFQTDQVIVKTLARKLDRKYAGMGRALRKRVEAKSVAKGYTTMLHAYIHSKNYSNVLSRKVGSMLYQKHVLFCKAL